VGATIFEVGSLLMVVEAINAERESFRFSFLRVGFRAY
jgi:hypothetical protein